MASKNLRTGDIVMSADGKDLGIVKQLGDTCFRINAPHRRDFWLSNDAVEGRDQGIAVLLFEHDRLGDAFVDVLKHSGAHSHPKQPSEGSASLLKPLIMLAGIGAMALRDKERREKVMEVTTKGMAQVKARMKQKKQSTAEDVHMQPPNVGYSATSTFVPPSTPATPAPPPAARPPSASFYEPPKAPPTQAPKVTRADLKAREDAVTAEVTKAFPAMNLRVSSVAVHTLEGKEAETLRFTLDETASSDVELEALARPATSESEIADEIIRDLRLQLPEERQSSG